MKSDHMTASETSTAKPSGDMPFSVLITVYLNDNVDHFIRAMESIWNDQHRKPDQIVLVSDGPLNAGLNKAVEQFQTQLNGVLMVVRLPENVGLAAALNEGLKECRHELVARMDADDISLPHRFRRQVPFMRDHPEVDVSSAWIREVDAEGEELSVRELPSGHEQISRFAKLRNPVSHPAAIFRKKSVLAVGGYPNLRKSQDYALWSLMLTRGHTFANLSEILLEMRTGEMLMRRGTEYLGHELARLRYQRKIGFLSPFEYLRNAALQAVIRLSPAFLKKLFYWYAR